MGVPEDPDLIDMNGIKDEEPPKSLIVTNIDSRIFDSPESKAEFETLFRHFDPSAIFHYLRCLRRVRVDFERHETANEAKISLDSKQIGNSVIRCNFLRVILPKKKQEPFLAVPPLTKQFLISPPVSPPVGWEQPKEDKPNTVIDYDVITAKLAQLMAKPGERHELHCSNQIDFLGESIATPSIVVDVPLEEQESTSAFEDDDEIMHQRPSGMKIVQTRCPERKSSLE